MERRDEILSYFEFEHLPEHLREVSMPFGRLAFWLSERIPPGPEKSAGLRKLLEAKDCAVRAALRAEPPKSSKGGSDA